MMEERLEMLKKMMEQDKEKLTQKKKQNSDGVLWRSATTQKSTKNYADNIVTQHRIANPNLPPTSMILGKEN